MTDLTLSARRFDPVDMSAVAPPAALEVWAFDAILDARFSTFLSYWAAAVAANPSLPVYDVTALRGNPVGFLQRVDAFREGLVRQRVNEAALATFLIFAQGADLDARAAEYNTLRAAGESDASLRLRALLAWENLSIGGSFGGYEYQARSVTPADILDCAVYGYNDAPGVAKGEVRIVLTGTGGQGIVPASILSRVSQRFTGAATRAVRKVNDWPISVAPAAIVPYAVDATLVIPQGADPATVLAAQQAAVMQYAGGRFRIGSFVDASSLSAALVGSNSNAVRAAILRAPFAGPVDLSNPPIIGGGPFDAPLMTSLTLNYEVAA